MKPGDVFGRLIVFARDLSRASGHGRAIYWVCHCQCGRNKSIRGKNLTSGATRSCGCLRRERASAAAKKQSAERERPLHFKHGHTSGGIKSPEFRTWCSMWERCTSPRCDSWRYYGARGIQVCERWVSFDAFLADMGARPSSRHSIDRINNNGNYEPSNCRWATASEQALNRRKRHA